MSAPVVNVVILRYRGSVDAIRWGDVLLEVRQPHSFEPDHLRRRFLFDRISGSVMLDAAPRDTAAEPELDDDPHRLAAVRAALYAREAPLSSCATS